MSSMDNTSGRGSITYLPYTPKRMPYPLVMRAAGSGEPYRPVWGPKGKNRWVRPSQEQLEQSPDMLPHPELLDPHPVRGHYSSVQTMQEPTVQNAQESTTGSPVGPLGRIRPMIQSVDSLEEAGQREHKALAKDRMYDSIREVVRVPSKFTRINHGQAD